MNGHTKVLLRARTASILAFLFFAPQVQSSPSIHGRWVAIPNCDVEDGQLCEAEEGFPWVEGIHAMLTHNNKLLLWRNTMHRHGVAIPAWRQAHLSRGEYARAWDGRSDGGQEVAAGVYLVQLHVGSSVISQKIVFAK